MKRVVGSVIILIVSSMLFTVDLSAAVGDCIKGQYNVYNEECKQSELDSDQCTTRTEQTPEARWCCCDCEYELSKCGKLFDSIFTGSKKSNVSKMMDTTRKFRDNSLKQSKLWSRYIDLYYKKTETLTNIMLKNPKLAKHTAIVLKDNLKLMRTLSSGKRAKVKAEHMFEVLRLLKEYASVDMKDKEMAKFAHQLSAHLMDSKWLDSLGITVVGDYVSEGRNTDSGGKGDDGKDKDPDGDPATCDKPVSPGMCPRQPLDPNKSDNKGCPEGCNKVNATQCSCPRTGPDKDPSRIGSAFDQLCNLAGVCW